MQAPDAFETVREYYGKILKSSDDLKTNACCSTEFLPSHIKSALAQIDDEVVTKFYGCGSPLPLALDGTRILDLGCGTGRDAFVASKLAGASGHVIGVDMTDEQLDVARRHVDSHMSKFGFDQPNIEFRKGFIEDLRSAGIEKDSVDLIISNCVINLSPQKETVFSEIFRVLKEGGELYFSDVFSDRRIPTHIADDPVLYGECLGGAMYYEDFRRLLADMGVEDVRIVSSREIDIEDDNLRDKVGNIKFTSKTIRAFKLTGGTLEDQCENYGQSVKYLGTIPESRHAFTLDDHHYFERGLPVPVCGNTAAMIADTRYGRYFEVSGDRSEHFGLFDCVTGETSSNPADCGC